MQRREFAPWPTTIPANSATIVLFTTHPRVPAGGTDPVQPTLKSIDRQVDLITVTWLLHNKASAANGLRIYARDNNGTWQETDIKSETNVATIGAAAPVQIPALSAGQEWRETIVVSHLNGFAVEYTAGADNPEQWAGLIALDLGAMVVQR